MCLLYPCFSPLLSLLFSIPPCQSFLSSYSISLCVSCHLSLPFSYKFPIPWSSPHTILYCPSLLFSFLVCFLSLSRSSNHSSLQTHEKTPFPLGGRYDFRTLVVCVSRELSALLSWQHTKAPIRYGNWSWMISINNRRACGSCGPSPGCTVYTFPGRTLL